MNQYSSLELSGEMRPERRGSLKRGETKGGLWDVMCEEILIGSIEKRRLRMLLESVFVGDCIPQAETILVPLSSSGFQNCSSESSKGWSLTSNY